MGARLNDRDDWFEIWFADKQGMIEVMASNLASDIAAGYNYFGDCIRKQMKMIEDYKAEFDRQMDEFKMMEEKAVNRWCFYDLKKRGAIE